MRIITGSHKGKRLPAPAGLSLRPTADRAKVGIFNIISHHFNIEDLSVLDLFAGTGNITFEFISRGCISVDAVDENLSCISFIRKTASLLDCDRVTTYHEDVFRFLQRCNAKYDLIFADPPFSMKETETIPDIIFERGYLNKGGWLVVEHSKKSDFSCQKHFFRSRKYGSVNFAIFAL